MHTVAMIMAMSGTRSELGFGQRHQMHQVRDICKSSLALINVTALSSGYDWRSTFYKLLAGHVSCDGAWCL